jgi:hypothetical protein
LRDETTVTQGEGNEAELLLIGFFSLSIAVPERNYALFGRIYH